MKKILIMTLALLLLLSAVLLAETDRRIGTAGAQILRIPVGSQGSSMGGSVIATTYGTEALFWNPAGAAMMRGTEVMFSHLDYFADMNLEYVAIVTNIEDFGTLGASVKVLSVGDILKTTWSDQQGTSGEMFNPTYSVISLSFSRQFTDRVSFGMTSKFINQKVEQVTASGLAFDFGFIYNPQWRGVKFGVVVKNFGPEMRFSGTGFSHDVIPVDNDPNSAAKTLVAESATFELPSTLQFGAAWDLLYNEEIHSLTVNGSFLNNNFSNDQIKGGVEYAYDDMFFLRGGYIASDQDNFAFGTSFGAGVKLNLGSSDLSFDYTWREMEFFDSNQFFTVKLGF